MVCAHELGSSDLKDEQQNVGDQATL
jgi:hypothetical protein